MGVSDLKACSLLHVLLQAKDGEPGDEDAELFVEIATLVGCATPLMVLDKDPAASYEADYYSKLVITTIDRTAKVSSGYDASESQVANNLHL